MDHLVRQHLNAGRIEEAYGILVENMQHKVFRLAFSLLRDEGSAEDAAQDALLRVWRALPHFEWRASLSTWVYTITRNVCLTRVRNGALERQVSLVVPGTSSKDAHHSAIDIELVLNQLPEKYRQVLELFYFEERSCESVAEMLNLPLATVKTHLHRARKALRASLEAQGAGAELVRPSK